MKKLLLIVVLSLLKSMAFAQESGLDTVFHVHHSVGLVISHTQVSQGVLNNGSKKWLALPSWGINYNYKFSKYLAIGLHNDIIIEDFSVESHNRGGGDRVLHRAYPFATVATATYTPLKHISFLGGAGGEFAHTGNLFLIRLGLEYIHQIGKRFELNACLVTDFKVNAYDSWALGFGISYIL